MSLESFLLFLPCPTTLASCPVPVRPGDGTLAASRAHVGCYRASPPAHWAGATVPGDEAAGRAEEVFGLDRRRPLDEVIATVGRADGARRASGRAAGPVRPLRHDRTGDPSGDRLRLTLRGGPRSCDWDLDGDGAGLAGRQPLSPSTDRQPRNSRRSRVTIPCQSIVALTSLPDRVGGVQPAFGGVPSTPERALGPAPTARVQVG